MKAAQWIDLVKVYRQWDSDYRTAKELGLSRNTISMYRSRTPTMDEETAVVVADALELDPATVLLDQVAERSKSEAVRAALAEYSVTDPEQLMSPGMTIERREEIRADIEKYGVFIAGNLDKLAAAKAREARRIKKLQAGAAHLAVLVTVALSGIVSSPSAHAVVTSPAAADKVSSVYYVKWRVRGFIRSLRRALADTLGGFFGSHDVQSADTDAALFNPA